MTGLDELIARIHPGDVEMRTIGEVTEVRSGWGFPNAEQGESEGEVPFFKVSDMNLRGNELVMARANNYVGRDAIARLRVKPAPAGTVIFPKIGAAVATNKKRLLGVASAYDNNVMGLIPGDELIPRYLLYWMQTVDLSRVSNDSGAVPSIRKSEMQEVRIAVPPLEVQRAIVGILDHFIRLEEVLQAELEARRTQRIALANNVAVALRDQQHEDAQSNRVTLGSVARESVEPVKVRAGQSYVSLGVKWNGEGVLSRDPRSGDSIRATTLYRARSGQLVFNRMFVVEGSFALVPNAMDGAVVSGEFPLFELDTSRVEPEWLLQFLCDPHTLKLIEREVTGTERGSMKSRRRWKADQFRAFEFWLPSLEAQRQTVSVLRSSNALIRSLEGELSARRKQYEYYRDMLLTFEEAAT
jgi:type I restriction enzyme S subunit